MNWPEILNLFLHNPKEPLLFHTGFFLFIFSIFLVGYASVYQRNSLRNLVIVLFGFYFYYKASGIFLLLLILTISADYFFSILIERARTHTLKKLSLVSGILFSLSFLLYFKYTDFFLENVALAQGKPFEPLDLVLPIGISFYTFQSISYLVDIYKGKFQRPSYSDYLMYMTFFPHLVAGPIVRARDFLPQLAPRTVVTRADLGEAFFLIMKGLVKKAIIADYVAQYSDAVFAQPEGFSGTENIVATLCYTLQIFCDFSGYTDMAIGVALLMGFRLCLNFDSPYKALNITDFWRRWHISLSSWLRDYIYIPMGGNRRGLPLQLLFLLLTMLIGGFWHGPSWKFVFWGAGHGVLLILHKMFAWAWPDASPGRKSGKMSEYDPPLPDETPKGVVDHAGNRNMVLLERAMAPVFWFITFACVALLWVPFRVSSMEVTWQVYQKIFSGFDWTIIEKAIPLNPLLYILLPLGYLATMQPVNVKRFVRRTYDRLPFLVKIILLILVVQCILQVRSESVQPFIYFEF